MALELQLLRYDIVDLTMSIINRFSPDSLFPFTHYAGLWRTPIEPAVLRGGN